MRLRETLPWNWGKKEVPVRHEGTSPAAPGTTLPAARSMLDIFDDFGFRPFALPSFPAMPGFGLSEDGGFLPVLDAKESDDEVRISVELPGLEEKDVEVALKDDVLTIRGEKHDDTKHDEDGAQWVERRFGSFQRAIPLPADVDVEAVKAHFKSGVLTITAPRTGKPDAEHREIPIQAG